MGDIMKVRSNNSIGELIRYFRIIKSYSQSDLAQVLNVTESAISTWERGISRPGVEIAQILSKKMQITLTDFFFIRAKQDSIIKNYELYDTIRFSRCYVDIQKINHDLEEQKLYIYFSVRGMTVDDHYLKHVFDIRLSLDDKETHPPISMETMDSNEYRSTMSPEFEDVPLSAKYYSLKATFELSNISTFYLAFTQNGEYARVVVNQLFLNILNRKVTLNIDNKTEDSNVEVYQNLYKTFLFLSKNKDYETLKFLFKVSK